MENKTITISEEDFDNVVLPLLLCVAEGCAKIKNDPVMIEAALLLGDLHASFATAIKCGLFFPNEEHEQKDEKNSVDFNNIISKFKDMSRVN